MFVWSHVSRTCAREYERGRSRGSVRYFVMGMCGQLCVRVGSRVPPREKDVGWFVLCDS